MVRNDCKRVRPRDKIIIPISNGSFISLGIYDAEQGGTSKHTDSWGHNRNHNTLVHDFRTF